MCALDFAIVQPTPSLWDNQLINHTYAFLLSYLDLFGFSLTFCHTNKYHHYRRNHSSLHSIATTPILDSGYNRYYSYCGPELLLERWIHGYAALPPIRSFTAKIIQRFHVVKAYIDVSRALDQALNPFVTSSSCSHATLLALVLTSLSINMSSLQRFFGLSNKEVNT
jgi:hypothetical protein